MTTSKLHFSQVWTGRPSQISKPPLRYFLLRMTASAIHIKIWGSHGALKRNMNHPGFLHLVPNYYNRTCGFTVCISGIYLFYNKMWETQKNHTPSIFREWSWVFSLGLSILRKVQAESSLFRSDKHGTVDDGWCIAAPLAPSGRFSLTSVSQVSSTSPSCFPNFYKAGCVETSPAPGAFPVIHVPYNTSPPWIWCVEPRLSNAQQCLLCIRHHFGNLHG